MSVLRNFFAALTSFILLAITACGGGGGRGIGVSGSAPTPPADNWVANAPVNAVAFSADGNTIYVGGNFTQIEPRISSCEAIDSTSGIVSSTFPKVVGEVYASAPDSTGGWFSGGKFSLVGNIARVSTAHILSDGSADPAFNSEFRGPILALTFFRNSLYVDGNFTHVGTLSRDNIAALSTSGVVITGFDPVANGAVHTPAISDEITS
jgi:hypothetical protein